MTRPQAAWRGVLVATLAGAALRVGSLGANLDYPHGDVVVDSTLAESLARGAGFWVPWESAFTTFDDPIGTTDATFGQPSDFRPPLWAVLGAPLARATGDGYLALQLLSWICGVLAIPAAAAVFARLASPERAARVAALTAWACALCLPLCDFAGNGSIYGGEALGVLLLALAAGRLERAREALLSGALLGALFLVSYRCGLLIPIFAVSAALSLGIRRSIRPLAIAAAACLAVTLPWFVRNALVFGDPFYTGNVEFLRARVGRLAFDVAGSRPRLAVEATGSEVLLGMAGWLPGNVAIVVAALPSILPVFALLAPGGFARAAAGRRLAGLLVLGAAAAMLAQAAAWPIPKTRHVAPALALVAGAACLELAEGPRWRPALFGLAAVWLSVMAGTMWKRAPAVWTDLLLTAPSLLVLGLALLGRAPRAAAPAALAWVAAIGAFHVVASLSPGVATAVYPARLRRVPDAMTVPNATFYDLIEGPFIHAADRKIDLDARDATAALDRAGAHVLLASAEQAHGWRGRVVASRGRVELPYLRTIVDLFRVDGIVMPSGYEREPDVAAWLHPPLVEKVFAGRVYAGYRVRR